MSKISVLSAAQVQELLEEKVETNYYGMYSTWHGGIVLDPWLMFVPVDDHIVHRGDGVFEAFKFEFGAVYDLQAHLDRLRRSAEFIALKIPHSDSELKEVISQLLKAVNEPEVTLRMFVSRGPGGFSPNPYESKVPQLYLVATPLKHAPAELYSKGAKMKISSVPVKASPFHRVKSCNYLQNVMMKKEAVDANVHFSLSFTPDGFVSEGSTENICIVNHERELLIPELDLTLQGTTLMVCVELAEQLVAKGILKSIKYARLTKEDVAHAKEVFAVGTTIRVMPVTEFERNPVNDGKPGPVAEELGHLLLEDMKSHPLRRHLVSLAGD